MTRVDFYFNVPDKLIQAAELAAIALAKQRRLFVFTSGMDEAAQMQTVLWSHPPTSFLPHCLGSHPLATETPIVIDCKEASLQQDDILINLSAERPAFFSRFRGLIELVGLEEPDRAEARARFRFYRDRGYDIHTHDIAGVDT